MQSHAIPSAWTAPTPFSTKKTPTCSNFASLGLNIVGVLKMGGADKLSHFTHCFVLLLYPYLSSFKHLLCNIFLAAN